MDTFKINDETLGFVGVDQYLTIKNTQGQTLVIKEKSMLEFEEFYKRWTLAMTLGGQDDFLNAWVYNQAFRELIETALRDMGITEVGLYTLSQLEALLVSYKGGPGLIFQLHQTFPKLSTQATKTMTWGISLKTALKLIISTLREFTHIKNWRVKVLSKVGLCLVLCASSLLNRMPKLLATQKQLKVCAKPNGLMTLEIPK